MVSTKGCWKCHALIRRGKLCADCVQMALLGGATVIFAQVVAHVLTKIW